MNRPEGVKGKEATYVPPEELNGVANGQGVVPGGPGWWRNWAGGWWGWERRGAGEGEEQGGVNVNEVREEVGGRRGWFGWAGGNGGGTRGGATGGLGALGLGGGYREYDF